MEKQEQNWNALWKKNENKSLEFGPSLRHKIRLAIRVMQKHGVFGREISLCDVACGSGVFLSRIQNRVGNVTGVDSSSVAIAMAQKRVPSARYAVLDIEAAAFPEIFDVVSCMNALEEMKDDAVAIHNMASMVKPGGYLLLVVPHAKKYWTKKDEDALNQRRYEINELAELCRKEGLEPVELFTWGWPMFSWYYAFLPAVNQEKLLRGGASRARVTRLVQQILYMIFFLDDMFISFGKGRVLLGLFRKIR